uniref:Hexosyltransferase n=1 Tax=Phallusia mammillata TaxID=59560 RepID=A0A6F9D6T6_9ASCI|nr:lactosylceramide 1,3-N-acetyl-beta-D-glucosaminyltransferase-like [Phallusia mammillata]
MARSMRDYYMLARKRKFVANFRLLTVAVFFWTGCLMCVPGLPYDAFGFIARKLYIPTDFTVYSANDSRIFMYPSLQFNYSINNPQTCSSDDIFLLIFVKTLPSHLEQRTAIRKSWGSATSEYFSPGKVKVLFMMGLENSFDSQLLQMENKVHQDIIQLKFVDSFHNLTVKLISQFKWVVKYCNNLRYVMTTDDDVYVNTNNLLQYLLCQSPNNLFVGCTHIGAAPIRNPSSKYYVNRKVYPGLYYPDYCTGSGYVLSFDALKDLHRYAMYVPMLYIDDVHSGILANAIGLSPVHNEWFLCEDKVSLTPHSLSHFITSHGHSPSNMLEMFHIARKFHHKHAPCYFT